MENSLNIVFPVHNVEKQLASHVERALELAGELTSRFEVLILDDASTDHTEEVAADLARRYPQVRVIRNDRHLGKAQTIRASLEHTPGDVVVIYEPDSPLSAARLQRLWSLREDAPAAIEQAEPRPQPHALAANPVERLTVWAESLRRSMREKRAGRSSHAVRRQAIAALCDADAVNREFVVDRVDGARWITRETAKGGKSSNLASRTKDLAPAE